MPPSTAAVGGGGRERVASFKCLLTNYLKTKNQSDYYERTSEFALESFRSALGKEATQKAEGKKGGQEATRQL